ncbi:hypothetical protein B0H17DRAFT_1139064 [Mycena rosella]|uniref:Uncharacterized protein n=1 Tax=Mycena rosella TaxID=1033263 RepID=A0AAD7D5G2_MYCRO|nr:hypothetical protein B0H17DRAFT_1139064 [Mycena rosella]
MAVNGLASMMNWRDKTFAINDVQRKWDDLKSRSNGRFSSNHWVRTAIRERGWNWMDRVYHLKYHHSHEELLFTPYKPYLLDGNEPAAIYFPQEMHDEIQRMFLMAILQTETD